jgi:hypothetical protein
MIKIYDEYNKINLINNINCFKKNMDMLLEMVFNIKLK